jgi:hypothetical protein
MLEKQNEVVSVRHKKNSFLATFPFFSYLVISYGDRLKTLFVSVRKNNDDVEEAQEIFSWSGISFIHFDIVYRIT